MSSTTPLSNPSHPHQATRSTLHRRAGDQVTPLIINPPSASGEARKMPRTSSPTSPLSPERKRGDSVSSVTSAGTFARRLGSVFTLSPRRGGGSRSGSRSGSKASCSDSAETGTQSPPSSPSLGRTTAVPLTPPPSPELDDIRTPSELAEDPTLWGRFRDYVMHERKSPEVILFLEATDGYAAAADATERGARGRDILEAFVRCGVPLEVNLSNAMRSVLLESREEWASDVFEEARRETWGLMTANFFRAFLGREAGRRREGSDAMRLSESGSEGGGGL